MIIDYFLKSIVFVVENVFHFLHSLIVLFIILKFV